MDGSLAGLAEWLAKAQAAERKGGPEVTAQATERDATPEAVASALLDGLLPEAARALRRELESLWQADDPDPEGELVAEALRQPCPGPEWQSLGVGTVTVGGLALGMRVVRDGELDERASAGAQALVLALFLASGRGVVEVSAVVDGLALVHEGWRDSDSDSGGRRPLHPLRELVRAWVNRPVEAPVSRHPQPFLPHIKAGGEPPERERGRLFGFVPDGRSDDAQLPLFGTRPGGIISQVPLLGIADATTGGAVTAQGRGAPLELALPIMAMLNLRPEDRRLPVVRIALTVRELRDALWPHGWQRNRDWPRLQHVLRGLGLRFVPWGNGGEWYPLSLVGLPGDAAGLDELVILDVRMPPGADQGTPIDRRRLAELRSHSGGAFRAFIASASLAWQPGTTRVRAGGRFFWTTDPERYPILTRQDRREIVFGGVPKRRTDTEVDSPFEELERAGDIIIARRDALDAERHETGWRIVPVAAATDGLRARIASGETDDG